MMSILNQLSLLESRIYRLELITEGPELWNACIISRHISQLLSVKTTQIIKPAPYPSTVLKIQ